MSLVLPSRSPRMPLKRWLGPKCATHREVFLPNIDLRRHVRSTPIAQPLERTREGCLALFSPRKGAWLPSHRPATGVYNASMSAVYIALPIALLLAVAGVVAFIWATKSGQMDDLETPGQRVLFDDDPVSKPDDSAEDIEGPST